MLGLAFVFALCVSFSAHVRETHVAINNKLAAKIKFISPKGIRGGLLWLLPFRINEKENPFPRKYFDERGKPEGREERREFLFAKNLN